MSRTIQIKEGREVWTLERPEAAKLEKDLIDALGSAVLDAMQAEADQILKNEVMRKWPVKTGKSLKGWDTGLRVDLGRAFVEVVFNNAARTKAGRPYVKFIQSSKLGKKVDAIRYRYPLVEHVRKPATAARRRLRKAIPKLLATEIQKSFRRS